MNIILKIKPIDFDKKMNSFIDSKICNLKKQLKDNAIVFQYTLVRVYVQFTKLL